METLVIYYSLNNHTKEIVEEKHENAIELKTVKQISQNSFIQFLTLGYKSLTNKRIDYECDEFNFSDYDEIILYSPIWAGRIANPMRFFITDNLEVLKTKSVTINSICNGDDGSAEKKCNELLPQAKYNCIKVKKSDK